MRIGKHEVANFQEPYIIAELGANHNGDMELARRLIRAAKDAGCHCVKFQSWTTSTIFSSAVYEENRFLNDDYRHRDDYTLEEIVAKFSMSEAQLYEMNSYCGKVGIDFASTPFSNAEVDFLIKLDVPFIKVASMDLNNTGFLKYIAGKGKPIMLSTGLSTLAEIDTAVEVIEESGNTQLLLFHCVSVYPPQDETVNLNNMDMLRNNFPDYPVGFSDHSIGVEIPLAAVAKGACAIEKHFTLDKEMEGWDHKVSATPDEMKQIASGAIRVARSLGSYRRVLSEAEKGQIHAYRRSIVAARDIPAEKVIEPNDLDVKRPGTGISPDNVALVIGRRAKRAIQKDRILTNEDF